MKELGRQVVVSRNVGEAMPPKVEGSKTRTRDPDPAPMAAGAEEQPPNPVASSGEMSSDTVSRSAYVRRMQIVVTPDYTSVTNSRERFVVMAMSAMLLLISCTLFAVLFTLLSDDIFYGTTVVSQGKITRPKVIPVPKSTSSGTTTTSTWSRTSTSSTTQSMPTTTTVITLFKSTPLVVCHLVSPSLYSFGIPRSAAEQQELPHPMLCDYILLDLPMKSLGTYGYESYKFLEQKNSSYRFLFNYIVHATDTSRETAILYSDTFKDSVRYIQQTLKPNKLQGLGVLDGLPVLDNPGGPQAALTHLNQVYVGLSRVLKRTGVDKNEVTNFFAFKPDPYITQSTYLEYLTVLNSIKNLRIVTILTVTEDTLRLVMPSSAWDKSCLPQINQTKMIDAVSAILSVQNPKVNFTLTLSLRLDLFEGVSLLDVHGIYLKHILCASHRAVWFATDCRDQLFGRDINGTSIYYIDGDGCAFAPGINTSDTVISFETARTVRRKMMETYQKLGYNATRTHVVGWTVYNVTHGLAPAHCNGPHNRIAEVRKVIEEIK